MPPITWHNAGLQAAASAMGHTLTVPQCKVFAKAFMHNHPQVHTIWRIGSTSNATVAVHTNVGVHLVPLFA